MTRSKMVFVLLVLLMALALVACSAPPPTSAVPSPAPSPAPKPSVSPTPTAAPPAAGQPKYGNVLRRMALAEPATFNPQRNQTYGVDFGAPVFNGLVRYDPNKLEVTPATIEGDLAEKWEVSPDGKTYTFYLRKGVKWHDGKPFTADDVIYSIERMMNRTLSGIAGNFPGYQSVQKVDDYTVNILLKQVQPAFLSMLAVGQAAILARHNQAADEKSTDFLMGTGPFKFKSRISGVSFEYVKNPDYFKKDKNGKPLPYLDGVSLAIIADYKAYVNAFITNRLDLVNPGGGISSMEIYDQVTSQAPKTVIQWKPTPTMTGMVFNQKTIKPLQDVRVRKAIAMVLDPQKAAVAAWGDSRFRGNEHGHIMAKSWSLPDSEVYKALGWDKTTDQRIAEAKKLLADAGYANGFSMKYVYNKTIAQVPIMSQFHADTLKRTLNIDLQLSPVDQTQMIQVRDSGAWDAYWQVIFSSVGDPDETMPYFLSSSPFNVQKYSNAKIDELGAAQSRETDLAKRRQIVNQIERVLLDDVPIVTDGSVTLCIPWWPYVKNFVSGYSSYTAAQSFEQVWFDK